MRPYAPDIDNPIPKPENDGNNNHRGGGPRNMPAFQPGQLNALAAQLSGGFGGGLGAWKRDMRRTYDPTSMKEFNFGGGHGGGHGGKGGDTPGTGPKPGDGGFTPTYPQHRMAPMQMNAQQPAMMPQMGLLAGNNMQARQTQPQGILGDIPPEVLAFIRTRGV